MKIEVGLLGILTIVFVALKLGGVIGWSWWCVFAPLCILFCVPCFILGIFLVFTLFGTIVFLSGILYGILEYIINIVRSKINE